MNQTEKKNPVVFAAAESDVGKPDSLWAAIQLISDVKKATMSLREESLIQTSWNSETKVCTVLSEEVYQDKTILVSQILWWNGSMWRLSEREEVSDTDTRWVGYYKLG